VSATAGVRYSDYSDVGGRARPRLSLVWRPADRHIPKAQYAEGFRSPTFFELYGTGSRNESLDSEVNRTSELNDVGRRPRLSARVTPFRSEIADMIYPIPGTGAFGNSRSGRSEGVELEWTQEITPGSRPSQTPCGPTRGRTGAGRSRFTRTSPRRTGSATWAQLSWAR